MDSVIYAALKKQIEDGLTPEQKEEIIEEAVERVLPLVDDKTYVHEQETASAEWTINHYLQKYPSVSVVDTAGTEVVGDVEYVDKNTCIVRFTFPFSGSAYLN